MAEIKKMYLSEKFGVFILAVLIFMIGLVIGISKTIIYLLSFLIIMEIVRTIYEYLVHTNHRIKMRYLIDSGILFGIRELYVAWTSIKINLTEGIVFSLVSIFIIGVLIFYRHKVIISSPDYLEKKGVS